MYNRFEDPEYIKWAKAVKQRDNYTCQICGREGGWLNSHHLNSWDLFTEQRFYESNGVTLCNKCHTCFHKIYKAGHNTITQFEEFKEILGIIKKAIEENK